MTVSRYAYFLDELLEDLHESIIVTTDIIKCVRSDKPLKGGYRPIIAYYYEMDECDEPHEEIPLLFLLGEIKKHLDTVD